MPVAEQGRLRACFKIFRVYGISPRLVRTYARYREFTRFAANLYFYYAVRYGKPRIGQSLMDALHDFLPYILVIGASSANRLACVVPTPDTCCVIGGKACKPQILTGRRSPAFSRRRHAGHPGPPAGWTHLDRCKLCSAGYGFPQGVGQQKSRLRFQGLMAFRYVLNQNLAVMIHNFRKKDGFCIHSPRRDGGIGAGQLQIRHPGRDSAKGCGRIVIFIRHGCDSHFFGVLNAQFR